MWAWGRYENEKQMRIADVLPCIEGNVQPYYRIKGQWLNGDGKVFYHPMLSFYISYPKCSISCLLLY